jgi:hypothetical protein
VAGDVRALGTLGAVLVLLGGAVVGTGYLYVAWSEEALTHCTTDCVSDARSVDNATTYSLGFTGAGTALAGVGIAILLGAGFVASGGRSAAPPHRAVRYARAVEPPLPPPGPP